jgi:amino acid transporter
MKTYTQIILVLISAFTILSLIMYPTIAPILATVMLSMSFAIGLYTIFQKHKKSDNSRFKIGKDSFILVFTIVLISFLSGIAGLFTNFYVSNLFGAIAGLKYTILIGFVIGYLVRKGIKKLSA